MSVEKTLADRLLIRELIGFYSDAVFRSDVEAYLACWSEDGVRIGNGAECRGKPALRAQWNSMWQMLDRMAFFTEIGAIEVLDNRATARTYCREIVLLKNASLLKFVGVYNDVLVREDHGWRFAQREYRLLMDEGAAPSPAA